MATGHVEWIDLATVGSRSDMIRNLQVLIPMAFHGGFEPVTLVDAPYAQRNISFEQTQPRKAS